MASTEIRERMLIGAVAFLPQLRDQARAASTTAATRLLRAAAGPLSLITVALEETGDREAVSCARAALRPTGLPLPTDGTDRKRLVRHWCDALDRLAACLPTALPSVVATARASVGTIAPSPLPYTDLRAFMASDERAAATPPTTRRRSTTAPTTHRDATASPRDHAPAPTPISIEQPDRDRAAERRTTDRKTAAEKNAGEESIGRKAAGGKSADEKAGRDRNASEKAGTRNAAAEKTAGEKAGRDKFAAEKAAAEKAAAEKAAGAKTAGENVTNKKSASSKTARRKTARKKTASKKSASRKTAGRKTAGRKTAPRKTASSKVASENAGNSTTTARQASAQRRQTTRGTVARRKATSQASRPTDRPVAAAEARAGAPSTRKVGPRRTKATATTRKASSPRRGTSADAATPTRKVVSRRKTAARLVATRRRIATRTTVTRRTKGAETIHREAQPDRAPVTSTAITPSPPTQTQTQTPEPTPVPLVAEIAGTVVTPDESTPTPTDAASIPAADAPTHADDVTDGTACEQDPEAAPAALMAPSAPGATPILPDPDEESGWSTTILTLASRRAEQLQFAVSDLRPLAAQVADAASIGLDVLDRCEGGSRLEGIARDMRTARADFRFTALETLIELVDVIGSALREVGEECLPELVVRAEAIHQLLDQFLAGIEVGLETRWPLLVFGDRIRALAAGHLPPAEIRRWHRQDPERVLELDLVIETVDAPPAWDLPEPDVRTGPVHSATAIGDRGTPGASEDRKVRVSVSHLERLDDLAGRLVLCKNRLFGLTRAGTSPTADPDRLAQLTGLAKEFEHLTTSLQANVLRTRSVPMATLLDRYVRVVPDVARLNERDVELEVVGGEIEIDRETIERLGEPLDRIVRFAVRCVEAPEDRRSAGKADAATMTVQAAMEDGHATIRVSVDGALPDRDEIERIVTSLGIVSVAELAALDDDEVTMLLTRDTFPNRDLAGIGGLLEPTRSRLRIQRHDTGLTCELHVPMRATSVRSIICRVGDHDYAVPIRNIMEIVRPDEDMLVHASRSRLLRRRNGLLPLIAAAELLEEGRVADGWTVLVVRGGTQTFGLMVDRVLGQEEVVIKSLGDGRRFGPIAGATIREDGGVSLILDVEAIEEAAKDLAAGTRRAA